MHPDTYSSERWQCIWLECNLLKLLTWYITTSLLFLIFSIPVTQINITTMYVIQIKKRHFRLHGLFCLVLPSSGTKSWLFNTTNTIGWNYFLFIYFYFACSGRTEQLVYNMYIIDRVRVQSCLNSNSNGVLVGKTQVDLFYKMWLWLWRSLPSIHTFWKARS